ncbi:hypothetical protein L1887_55742 [Cichorium endivia]|nr:hypothetical protein L1887_55742 [Cichorium endivia]
MSDSLVRVSRRAEWGAHRAGAGSTAGISPRRRVLPNHDRRDGISTSLSTARALAAAPIRTGPRPESIGGPAIAVPHPTGTHRRAPIRFPSRQFQALFDSLFKVLFIFPLARYLFAIGLTPVFSLGRNLPPYWGLHSPNNPTRQTAPRGCDRVRARRGSHLSGAPFQGTWARSAAEDASPDYNSDSEAVRFSSWADPGVARRLLRESLASLTAHDARHNTRVFSTTTSRASTEGDSSLGQPHHKHGRPISAPMPCVPIRDAWLGGDAMRDAQAGVHVHGSFCFAGFDNDPSAGSPTETLLRLLLPLNDKVQWNSRDVAGGEPPTSPRS